MYNATRSKSFRPLVETHAWTYNKIYRKKKKADRFGPTYWNRIGSVCSGHETIKLVHRRRDALSSPPKSRPYGNFSLRVFFLPPSRESCAAIIIIVLLCSARIYVHTSRRGGIYGNPSGYRAGGHDDPLALVRVVKSVAGPYQSADVSTRTENRHTYTLRTPPDFN